MLAAESISSELSLSPFLLPGIETRPSPASGLHPSPEHLQTKPTVTWAAGKRGSKPMAWQHSPPELPCWPHPAGVQAQHSRKSLPVP